MSFALGVSFTADQVRNRARRIRAFRPSAENPTDSAAAAVAGARLKALRLAESRDLVTAVKDAAKWQDFLDVVKGELLIPPSERPLVIPPSGAGTPETMCVLVSDIHIGKLVREADTGDGFGYNIDSFKVRGEELLASILRLRDIHSAHNPIPRLALFFLGDGVDGVDMRRGHGLRVDVQTATQQTIQLAQFFTWLVGVLEPYFADGIDLRWLSGNHGRVGDFGVALPSDNWDFLAGVMVQQNVQSENVRVDVPTQKFAIYQVGPLSVYAAHGDMIRGGGGSPVVKRHAANLQNLLRRQIDVFALAHFHTSEMFTAGGAKILMNGAWDGGDSFSVNQLVAASDPVQWALSIHPRRGLTWAYEMQLGPRRQPAQFR